MPKILITGVNGFTGRYVADLFVREGYDVIGLVHGVPGENQVACDLTDRDAVFEVVRRMQPDGVIHLAALSFVGHDNPEEFYNTNVVGTLNIIEAYSEFGSQKGKIIVASSANVYGTPDVEIIDELIAPAPVNHYAASKVAMEHLVRTWFDRLSIIITRPFNYTGSGQDSKFLVPKIVDHFKRKCEVIELGNTDVYRDFTDVRDVAEAYFRLYQSSVRSETINICSGRVSSLQEIISKMNRLAGYEIKVRVNPDFVRENEIRVLKGSCEKLGRLTGFKPLIELDETLSRMLSD